MLLAGVFSGVDRDEENDLFFLVDLVTTRQAANQAKGWLLDVMRCVENLGKKEFSLGEVYRLSWSRA
jgi:type II restriction enzyme